MSATMFNFTPGFSAVSKELPKLSREYVENIVAGMYHASTVREPIELYTSAELDAATGNGKITEEAPADVTKILTALGITQELVALGKEALKDHRSGTGGEEIKRKTWLLKRVHRFTYGKVKMVFVEKLFLESLLDANKPVGVGLGIASLKEYLLTGKLSPDTTLRSVVQKNGTSNDIVWEREKRSDEDALGVFAALGAKPKKRNSKA